jgi:hypothetical protein
MKESEGLRATIDVAGDTGSGPATVTVDVRRTIDRRVVLSVGDKTLALTLREARAIRDVLSAAIAIDGTSP